MFDEPTEDPTERTGDPKTRATEKAVEFCMHAEIFAIFEGQRKFDAQLRTGLDADVARKVQREMAKLEKAKGSESPVVPEGSVADAAALLMLGDAMGLATNDYHIHRRPGEVMILRWLAGAQVESFYERFQAHFDAAMTGFKEEERQEQAWKQDPETLAYLAALDGLELRMAERYLREPIRAHGIFVLSTQTADEFNIAYLGDYVMGVKVAEITGSASAPPEAPTERDLAWFFKLFSLRGMVEGVERMCFFTFLQKSDDSF